MASAQVRTRVYATNRNTSTPNADTFVHDVVAAYTAASFARRRPDCGTYLRDDGLLFVLNKRAFRWGKDGERWRERIRSSGFRMHVGARRRIGEWFVSATMVVEEVKEGEEREARNMVKSKPWQSLER